ncbi:hypothetical protein MRS44_013907 [Fusarium solani]|uniref:uncharacterized protein n=1 Tax=Fusarium solani TaxID=169388 RepID=UPI0032C4418C|nr:hypothetical protein MRS44_013907 [Fusarium solani]
MHQPSIVLSEHLDELSLLKSGGRLVSRKALGNNNHNLIPYFDSNGSPTCPHDVKPAEYMYSSRWVRAETQNPSIRSSSIRLQRSPERRCASGLPAIFCKAIIPTFCFHSPPPTSRTMALFPRHFYNSDSSFTPLFRLLDDYDSYTRQGQSGRDTSLRRWQPKFDICETSQAYELHGELPGMDKKAVHIEFTEPQTMVIRGKSERTYTSGNPPAGFIEGTAMRGAIVGDDGEPDTSQPAQRTEETDKKMTRRSTGSLSDSVSAKFQDGILSIVVPKVKKHESRRIHVS